MALRLDMTGWKMTEDRKTDIMRIRTYERKRPIERISERLRQLLGKTPLFTIAKATMGGLIVIRLGGISIQRRGWIIDVIPPRRFSWNNRCYVFCLRHLRLWPEGDYTREWGGRACDECVSSWAGERTRP